MHEPAGNTDWWEAIGDVPPLVMVVVMGAVEYIRHDGVVLEAHHDGGPHRRLQEDTAKAHRDRTAACPSLNKTREHQAQPHDRALQ